MADNTKEKDKNIVDSVMYSYSTASSLSEEENRVLRETVAQLKAELERYKVPPSHGVRSQRYA